jgi:regulator of sigma E protease
LRYGLFESIPAGISRGIETTANYLKQFKLFFLPETKAYESLGGFITIGNIFPGTWDWHSFWNMTAFISIILAIMNLLPIPGLDGGHVMFVLYEMVTRRKPSDKFMEYAQMTGLILLLILVFYANANDIIKLFR